MLQPATPTPDLCSMNSRILAFDLDFEGGFDLDELDRRLDAGLQALPGFFDVGDTAGDACFNFTCTGYWPSAD